MTATVEWGTVIALLAMIGTAVGAWATVRQLNTGQERRIFDKIDESRAASEVGRGKIYLKIDHGFAAIRAEMVSRDAHDRDMLHTSHAIEELSRKMESIDERINASCAAVRETVRPK